MSNGRPGAWLAALPGLVLMPPAHAAPQPQPPAAVGLPTPTSDPLQIDPATDPVLRLARTATTGDELRATVATAIARSPALAEAEAERNVAAATRGEARAGLFPTVDAVFSSYRSLANNFGPNPETIVERSRSQGRTDAILSVEQRILDFGATSDRIVAAGARLRSASANAEAVADQTALRTIAAWYDVFGYRALVALGVAYRESQGDLKSAIEARVKQGVSAPGDAVRVESAAAAVDARIASYRRQLANAEARYTEMVGTPPPQGMLRAPALGPVLASADAARLASGTAPGVRGAEADATAARRDADAARADTLPNLSAGIDAGRYGVFENRNDYDVTGRLTLRKRFFGGVDAAADQVRARSAAADARYARVREETARDAAIAWTDVRALEAQLAAQQASYFAARRSRDVLVERFRAARGTLFDVLLADDTYFGAAAGFIELLTERDAAHYVLLSRTGRLLDALNLPSGKGPSR